jgi:putative FmdB family regulatory protein
MPIYEYKCGQCRYHFETEQRITEKPLEHCPKCTGKIHRIIFPTGIVFKGSGFHVTDYGRGSAGTKPAAKESHKELSKESKKQKDNKTPGTQDTKSASMDGNKQTTDKKISDKKAT